MSQGGYTIGLDVAIDILGPYGAIRIDKITAFDSKPKTSSTAVTALNGETDELLFLKGWQGTIDLERTDSTVDDWWAQFESDFYNGKSTSPATITETISEPDGSTTTWRYQRVVLTLADAGKKQGDKTVPMQMTFTAARRVKVS